MPTIKAVPEKISMLHSKLASVQKASDEAVSSISKVKVNLDWQVASRSNIDEKLTAVQKRLRKQSELMNSYVGFLNTVNSKFGETDGNLRNQAKGLIYQLGQMTASFKAFDTAKLKMDYKKGESLAKVTAVSTLFGASMLPTYSSDRLLDHLNEKFKIGSKTDKDYSKMNDDELAKVLQRVSDEKIELLKKAGEFEKKLNDIKACLLRNGIPEDKINAILGNDVLGLGGVDLSSSNMPEDPNLLDAIFKKDTMHKEFYLEEIKHSQSQNDELSALLERKKDALSALDNSFSRMINWPIEYKDAPDKLTITSDFGPRVLTLADGTKIESEHKAVDIAHGGTGDPHPVIIAAVSGTVKKTGYQSGGLGNFITIKGIDGREYTYGHLDEIYKDTIKTGEYVNSGSPMGKMGNTGFSQGTHLHFVVKEDGEAIDPQQSTLGIKGDMKGNTICSICTMQNCSLLE